MPPSPQFSDSEIAIAKYICKQMSNQEIAAKMKYSVRTVESMRLEMTRKMKVKNVVGVVLFAIKKGWIKI